MQNDTKRKLIIFPILYWMGKFFEIYQSFFQKPIDKVRTLCYNNDIRLREINRKKGKRKMSAENTVYYICRDEVETSPIRTALPYSSKELINDYWNRTSWDYNKEDEFYTYEEAKEAFDKYVVSDPSLRKTSYGYTYLLYEIVFIQKVVLDEDGEIDTIEELDQKTGSYTPDEN